MSLDIFVVEDGYAHTFRALPDLSYIEFVCRLNRNNLGELISEYNGTVQRMSDLNNTQYSLLAFDWDISRIKLATGLKSLPKVSFFPSHDDRWVGQFNRAIMQSLLFPMNHLLRPYDATLDSDIRQLIRLLGQSYYDAAWHDFQNRYVVQGLITLPA